MIAFIGTVRKLIIYIVGVATGSATAGVLPAPWDAIAPLLVGVVLGVVHYHVPNAPAAPADPKQPPAGVQP